MNLSVDFAGVKMKNPVTTASGTFGSGAEYGEFVDLSRLGAVTTKGVANVPWPGNPTPRVCETYGGMLNAIGLQNPGIDLFVERDIPFLKKYDTNIIVNVCGKTPDEYLEVVKRYLAEDYIPYTAQGGRAALDLLMQQKVDLILLDVEMPVLDGFHTLDSIRKMETAIDVPVIFVTGRHDRFTVFHSVQRGVDGYIVKPFEKEALLQKIEEVLHTGDETANNETILAVDDDMAFLKMLKPKLQKYYNVVAINSPKLALEYLSKHKPSLILLDYQMPMYSGASLLGMIRKNSSTKKRSQIKTLKH